jgi:putative hydrolase of the HAD superfamily
VLFDAGNTLVFLDYTRIAAGVATELELALRGEELAACAGEAARAMERAGSDQERTAAYFEALFLQAGIPSERLAEVRGCLTRLHRERHLWCSVPASTRSALARLKAAGLLLGVVSNSEGRVEEALEAAGLRDYFDVVIDSGLIGIEKPDPRIFQAALEALAVSPEEAIYVGDLYEIDVVGARAAGIEAVLVTTTSIHDLAESLLAGDESTRMIPSNTEPK